MSNKQNDAYNEYIIPYNEFEDYLKEKKFKNVKSIASQLVHRVKIHDELVEALGYLIKDIKDNFSGTSDIEYINDSYEKAKKALLKAKANQ